MQIGDVEPIAGQVIELAKKSSSTDNISVIAIFFKDPKQIIAEYKSRHSGQLTQMDYETNGIRHLDDGLIGANVHHERETPSPDKLEFNKSTVVAHETLESNEFYFGKNGDINTLVQSSFKSNGDDGDKFSSNELNQVDHAIDDEHDDFGPETDVDATDDAAISPLSPSVSTLKH